MQKLVLLFGGLALLAIGCSSNTAVATGPTPVPTPQPVTTFAYSGTVTATNGGQPLAGVTVTVSGQSATTDVAGVFSLVFTGSRPTTALAQLTGTSIVPRTAQWPSQPQSGIALEAFQSSTFDLTFYRQFVRDGFEQPNTLLAIRRWTQAPKVYMRTVDEAGNPIDAVTLDTAASTLLNAAGTWSGDRFGLVALERGTDTREGVSGWITVKWPNPADTDSCGIAQVGTDGGWIRLNYLNTACACNGSRMRPRTVRHELGHAFGYWHTGNLNDVMSGLSVSGCDQLPSGREQQYARYAYSRPVGNTDQDSDPATVLSTPKDARRILD